MDTDTEMVIVEARGLRVDTAFKLGGEDYRIIELILNVANKIVVVGLPVHLRPSEVNAEEQERMELRLIVPSNTKFEVYS